MLKIINNKSLSSEERKRLTLRDSAQDKNAIDVAEQIILKIEREGKSAVLEFTEKFDNIKMRDLTVSDEEIDRSEETLDKRDCEAFQQAAANIKKFHETQLDNLKAREINIAGTTLGYKFKAIHSTGVYVPGGKALYPSSVLMGVIPAVIAEVQAPLLITPPDETGSVHPAVLYCAKLAGTRMIIKHGGAQGIAAAAFGLAFPPVQLLVGPGNRYVTAAKQILAARGLLKIDMPAGPSEVVIIADDTARAKYLAADLLSQAEHGEDSPAILLTDSAELADEVAREIEKGIDERPDRRPIKTASIQNHSYAIVFDDLEEAFTFANDYAPEHLEICTVDPCQSFEKIENAGSVFLGNYAPVALGDYISGTNHILPTGGSAKSYSGLGLDIFMKRITYQYPTRESLKNVMDSVLRMSRIEGFDQEHGHSVAVRYEND